MQIERASSVFTEIGRRKDSSFTRRNFSSPSFVGSFFLFKGGGQQVLVNST